MEAQAQGRAAAATSPTSTTRPGTANSARRKRSAAEFESSPGTGGEADEDEHERHVQRQPGVKRACNECRQQKLRCDVQQDPFRACQRCTRLKLTCKIESNFKRVGKRSKHAEMEKNIEFLQEQLRKAQEQGFIMADYSNLQSPMANGVYSANNASFMGSEEAVSSLLHLKQGGGSYSLQPRIVRELEGVGLTEEAIHHLFNEFWSYYHPFLPFLDPLHTPDQYYQQHPLLFWVIISVAARRYTADSTLLAALGPPLGRLLWSTVGEVPSNYYVVKALCLLCTWPLPTSTTSTDPTHILGGVMMKTATGIGLHRPSHTQDFSRVSVELNREQLHDRVTTWAVCNIVSQNLGTGFGQPASTLYDWTLAIRPGEDGPYRLSPELEAQLEIARFCDKISKEMYSNHSDPRGVAGDELRATLTRIYRRGFGELQASILSRRDVSPLADLYLKAAGLHLRLSAFFDSPTTKDYMDDLMSLWRAAHAFLDVVFQLQQNSLHGMNGKNPLRFATNYILQMIIAASFTLLKLLSSFFAQEMKFNESRQIFHRTIQVIRDMSVANNDLPWRLAELMVQMYNGARVEARNAQAQQQMANNGNGVDTPRAEIDDSLQLKVRCRMSMSLVFDSIWRWREEFQAQGRGNLEGKKQPTKCSDCDSSDYPDDDQDDLITDWDLLLDFSPFPMQALRIKEKPVKDKLSGRKSTNSIQAKLSSVSAARKVTQPPKVRRSTRLAVNKALTAKQTNMHPSKTESKLPDYSTASSAEMFANHNQDSVYDYDRGKLPDCTTADSQRMFVDSPQDKEAPHKLKRTKVSYKGQDKLPDIKNTRPSTSRDKNTLNVLDPALFAPYKTARHAIEKQDARRKASESASPSISTTSSPTFSNTQDSVALLANPLSFAPDLSLEKSAIGSPFLQGPEVSQMSPIESASSSSDFSNVGSVDLVSEPSRFLQTNLRFDLNTPTTPSYFASYPTQFSDHVANSPNSNSSSYLSENRFCDLQTADIDSQGPKLLSPYGNEPSGNYYTFKQPMYGHQPQGSRTNVRHVLSTNVSTGFGLDQTIPSHALAVENSIHPHRPPYISSQFDGSIDTAEQRTSVHQVQYASTPQPFTGHFNSALNSHRSSFAFGFESNFDGSESHALALISASQTASLNAAASQYSPASQHFGELERLEETWMDSGASRNAGDSAAMKNPTNPDSAAESSASSTHHLEMDATLMPPNQQLLTAAAAGLPSSGLGNLYGENNYEVFDPLNWMLDGLVDFPYSYNAVQGLEASMS